ncbi:hypothetical protein J6590_022976 [Homalodisca vitripennis]|nr:hypothetical protein J6590_022976 [Homalodisca vitripennis]
MGCIRDLIQPGHFIEKVVEFQRKTNATVYVLSYEQGSKRELRDGLPHSEFLEKLRGLLASHYEERESAPTVHSSPPDLSGVDIIEICGNNTTPLHSPALSQTYSTPSLSDFPSPTTPPILSSDTLISTPSSQKNFFKDRNVNPS